MCRIKKKRKVSPDLNNSAQSLSLPLHFFQGNDIHFVHDNQEMR